MTERKALAPSSRPKLQPYVRLQYDKARKRWVMQAPERVLVLDETSKAIVDLCGGEQSITGIVQSLSSTYEAPEGEIEHDVVKVLELFLEKGFLVVEDGS